MGKDPETVRFLDDIDFTFSLDSRSSENHQMTSIEVSSQPIVFRASYRDINLITTIVNKAIQLYTESTQKRIDDDGSKRMALTSRSDLRLPASRQLTKTTSHTQPIGHANVVLSKEQVKQAQVPAQIHTDVAPVPGFLRRIPPHPHRRSARTTDGPSESEAIHLGCEGLVGRSKSRRFISVM